VKDSIVATAPEHLDTSSILLPKDLLQSGILMEQEGKTIVFRGVRADQRQSVRDYLASVGLEYDPVGSFWVV